METPAMTFSTTRTTRVPGHVTTIKADTPARLAKRLLSALIHLGTIRKYSNGREAIISQLVRQVSKESPHHRAALITCAEERLSDISEKLGASYTSGRSETRRRLQEEQWFWRSVQEGMKPHVCASDRSTYAANMAGNASEYNYDIAV